MKKHQTPGLNSFMIFDASEILPAALSDLTPLHQQIATYLMSLEGKRPPAYCYAMKHWGLGKKDFDDELASTMIFLRAAFGRRGIHKFTDLDLA